MTKIDAADFELIEAARAAIAANYDGQNFLHTVGAAVRCANGRVYVGVNCYSLHGVCAEQVAIGTAVTNGERCFSTIVAVRGGEGGDVLPPCGNCRQMLADYCPSCMVIVGSAGDYFKVRASELLPFAYTIRE